MRRIRSWVVYAIVFLFLFIGTNEVFPVKNNRASIIGIDAR